MITIIIILLTAVVSILCFYNDKAFGALSLQPELVWRRRQWYRLVTHGFVHGDFTHLFVNMLVLLSFGTAVEKVFGGLQSADYIADRSLTFLLLYFSALVAASLYDLFKHKNNPYFVSIGASGAVSAVVFCSIFFAPLSKIYLFGLIPIPGIIFGILYIFYESFSAGKGGKINHNAHIFGAIFGFIFPLLIDPNLFNVFLAGF